MIHLLIDSDSLIVFQRSENSVFHGELMPTCRAIVKLKAPFQGLALPLILLAVVAQNRFDDYYGLITSKLNLNSLF